MPRKKAAVKVKTTKRKASQSFFTQYLRLGESYTSLVLGIIVVIIATVLLLSFVQNRQADIPKEDETQLTLTKGEIDEEAIATVSASVTVTEEPTPTQSLPTATPILTMIPEPTKIQEKLPFEKETKDGEKMYTVKEGDNLWVIAEKIYKSGYNWVDIARANKLNDPNDIHVGNKLILPQVTAKIATVNAETKGGEKSKTVVESKKITTDTYKVAKGDTLWDIAVRAYGDGYAWTKIADANKLKENPNLIHVGNTIKIPRK